MYKGECKNIIRHFFLIIISVFAFSFSWGQGIVRGKVTDENGEPAIGATVVLKSNKTIGASINFDGDYSLKLTDSLPQTLVVSYMGYKTIEEPVRITKGQVLIKNFDMKPAATEIKEVEIVGKANKAKDFFMEKVKMNSVTTMDYISSETMKKSGDANVSAAVARVPGVSTSSRGFITVRGIGDRYVKTTINGLTVPTLDPYTNNLKLDLFPSSLVDNIILVKTASPDLPGDWAGAYLSVETKDYPEKFLLNVESSFGYNNQSTFKEIITSDRSSTDWLGFDNNLRDIDHTKFVEANTSPTEYEKLVALGLGNYFSSIGVTKNTDLQADGNNEYFKLALVQLGLLAPANFTDNSKVNAAVNAYKNGSYSADAFKAINANVADASKMFPNNWDVKYVKAPISFSQSFSIGNQIKLFGKPFGFITGFRYGSSIVYDPNAYVNRAAEQNGENYPIYMGIEQSSKENNGWSALMNAAYKYNSNSSISFLFMPNFLGVNNVRYTDLDVFEPEHTMNKQQFYEQRKQLVYQLKADNYIPGPKIKTELSMSYTDGKSNVPDFKFLQYVYNPSNGVYGIGGGSALSSRAYRYLTDNVFDSHLKIEFLNWNKPGLSRKLVGGISYQQNHKKSSQYSYNIFNGNFSANASFDGDFETYYQPKNFDMVYSMENGIPKNSFNMYYTLDDVPADRMFGRSNIKAGFLMTDYTFIPSLRFSGGLRVEQAYEYTDAFKYDSLGYASDDPRRYEGGGGFAVRPGKLNEVSYLPSASFIYKLKNDEAAPINLRLNYSQTVARPSIRELAEVSTYDYELRAMIYGRADLKMAHAYNYDFRIESYFKSGDNISLSLFYKNIKNNLEIADAVNGYSWQNVDSSFVRGIELEGKKTLFKNWELKSNITLVQSKTSYINMSPFIENGVKVYKAGAHVTRSMFGQSPYVVNAMLSYRLDSAGLNLSLSYNIQGSRLVISGATRNLDIYELPRHVLDFKATKTIGKHFSASVTVRDLFNSPITRSYNFTWEGKALPYDQYRYGTNYIVAISYKL